MKSVREYDVAVAGGGIAGIAAALSAARNGAKTCIVEKEVMLGGLATAGLIVIYLPLCDGMGNQIIYGIGEELLELSIKYDTQAEIPAAWKPGASPDLDARKKQRYSVTYNPYLFAIAAEELLQSEGVDLIYDSVVTALDMQQSSIASLNIYNKSGNITIRAKSFVDATGDADLCHLSGENTAVYRENKLASWNYYFDGKAVRLHGLAEPLYEPVSYYKRLYDGTNYEDITQSLLDSRQMLMADLQKKRENNPQAMPVTLPSIPLMRMTRRLVGAYELDESEERKWFDDAVGMTGDWRKPGPVFYLPYRCLYGRTVKNLITAGRCISATTPMWDITRVIPTCAVTGQAAGAAAALQAQDKNGFEGVSVRILQEKLGQQGVRLNREFISET